MAHGEAQIKAVGSARLAGVLPALFGAVSLAVAADFWQHSIHINSHIVTVALNALAVFALVRWQGTGRDRWLYLFCVTAGLGPTHHPLTVFSFPAYTVFILLVRPGIVNVASGRWWKEKRWQTLLAMLLFGLLGLAVWLYYPIRSAMKPEFGPDDMNTLDGFLNVALARGLTVNLFHFGLSQQGQRLLVFWTLLRQQYALPVIALAAAGLGWLALKRREQFILLLLMLLANLAFILNTVQDVMAYLLTPFMLVGLLAGLGAFGVVDWLTDLLTNRAANIPKRLSQSILWVLVLMWPVINLVHNTPVISLRDYREGDEYVAAVWDRFEGTGEGAVLLNDWEHITPLWYEKYVEKRWPDPADVTPYMVSTARPWVKRVFDHLPGGPVYLNGYRQEIVDAGFRLRPDGDFYRVVEPGESSLPAGMTPLEFNQEAPIDLLANRLNGVEFQAGGVVWLDLAMRAPAEGGTLSEYLVPYARLGDIRFEFTTDGHLITPQWLPGEAIVERFSFMLPLDLPPGRYPLSVGLNNLTAGTSGNPAPAGEITVRQNPAAPTQKALDNLLANFGQRVGVDRVTVKSAGANRTAVWSDPLLVHPGSKLDVLIRWRCLAPVEESYTVFVHLMDGGNRIWAQEDYTPLGGSFPTYLWFPKWLPGQTALDPYRLVVPADAPPGEYYIEIGLYGMTTHQRVYQYDRDGNLAGDRLVLGPIKVQ